MTRRSNRRRTRNAHTERVPHLCDTVTIDAAACRAALRDEGLTDAERLMLLVSIASGDCTMTVAELRHAVLGAVVDAGSVEAAIERRQIVLR